MRESHRKAMLFAILAGVVALIFLDTSGNKNPGRSRPPGSPLAKNDVVAATPGPKGEPMSATLSLPERPALGEPAGELFGSHSWQPPPPKVVAAPAKPSAPPMPYRFAGKLIQNGQLQVFLSKGDTPIPIKQGEVLDGTYRVESIAESGITLVYLPLGHKEHIPAGGTLPAATAAAPLFGATPPTSGPQPGLGTIPIGAVVAPAPAIPFPPRRDGAASTVTEPKAENRPARLLWEGPQQVKVGANFSVALRVISDLPLRASPMQVRFDPTVLESVAVRPGKFYGAEAGRGFSYRVNPDGSIFIGASNQGGPTSSSDMELLILTFKPIKPASSAELSIASLTLEGPAGRVITLDQLAAFKTAITP